MQAQSLDSSPAFDQTVAKLMRYPTLAYQQRKVSKAYINFKVDTQGQISNVSILNAAQVDPLFQQEIKRVWRQLPLQSRQYQGEYIMPLSFMLDSKNGLERANSESPVLSQKSGSYTLLKEVAVTAIL